MSPGSQESVVSMCIECWSELNSDANAGPVIGLGVSWGIDMSINEEIQKAQALERQALNKLNGGKSWIERHPGWTLMIGVVLLLGDVILAFKAYG